jgi:hypothetical protein
LQVGREIMIDRRPHFWVPWPEWQERATLPVGMQAPERGEPGMRRRLARVERKTRLARHQLEIAHRERLETILVLAQLGWSRRRIGALLGVSGARVQQLVDDAPDDISGDALLLVRDAKRLLARLPTGAFSRDDLETPPGWDRLKLSRILDRLIELELLESLSDGREVAATAEARAAFSGVTAPVTGALAP